MSDDAAPVARIHAGAVVANVRASGLSAPLVDLRRDAYGHGAAVLSETLLAQTDARVILDGDVHPGVGGDQPLGLDEVFGWTRGEAAMTLVGTVLSVKDLLPGEGVSYGYRHRAVVRTRVALVTGGYAQGVVRSLGGAASVHLDGKQHPIVGRVAMDVCVVDVGDAAIARGAEAVFFGAGGASVSAWARATGLREAEIVTAVGLRARREFTS